jgi:predicted dehydrogenase
VIPTTLTPIVVIGAGGIVNDAHLPAYRLAQFPVAGIFDKDRARASETARRWGISKVFNTLDEALSSSGVIFDLAVPPENILEVLTSAPAKSRFLIQKPMGRHFQEAKAISKVCEQKEFLTAINFQLRYAPAMIALREALNRKLLGEIVDLEVRLNLYSDWSLFPFLQKLERVELQIHSIHYLDLIRSLLGNPRGVYARTLPDPRTGSLASSRSAVILNYGERIRCLLSINHNYPAGQVGEMGQLKIEGTEGVAVVKMGVLVNYPKGEPDSLRFSFRKNEWHEVPLIGNWFPEAFIGTMASMQSAAANNSSAVPTHYHDALQTMALVEACYLSHASGGTPLPQ